MPESESESLEFWQRQAIDALTSRLAIRPSDPPSLALNDEIEELLWAFAEGRLPEPDAQRLWEFVTQMPEARAMFEKIHDSIERTSRAPLGDPTPVWTKLAANGGKSVRSASTAGPFDVVLRLVEEGLELLSTTGRAAFAPALARSEGATPATTAALEFLTSAGTLRVIVDQRGLDSCDLTVIPVLLAGKLDASELDLEVRDGVGTLWRSEPFEEGRARVRNLRHGPYRLVLCREGNELASLSLDLRDEQ